MSARRGIPVGSGWKRIKLYDSLYGIGIGWPIKEQVGSMLVGTDPDAIDRAGRSLLKAAELIDGDGAKAAGILTALRHAAGEPSQAWTGGAAVSAQSVPRRLYATVDALGETMRSTGTPFRSYADQLQHYQATMPGQSAPPAPAAPTPQPSPGPSPVADEQARKHLRRLNQEIVGVNLDLSRACSGWLIGSAGV